MKIGCEFLNLGRQNAALWPSGHSVSNSVQLRTFASHLQNNTTGSSDFHEESGEMWSAELWTVVVFFSMNSRGHKMSTKCWTRPAGASAKCRHLQAMLKALHDVGEQAKKKKEVL